MIEKFDIQKYTFESFKNYIFSLSINADKAIGIDTKIKQNKNGEDVLTRDAINQPEKLTNEMLLESDVYANMMILTNRVVALNDILKKSNINNKKLNAFIGKEYDRQFEKLNKFLSNKTNKNLFSVRKELYEIGKDFDSKINKILKNSNIPDYKKRFSEMLFQQSINAFDSIPIVTRSKIKGEDGTEYTKIIYDKPLQVLSDEQKESIKSGSYKKQDWYKNLNDLQKKNFEELKDVILNDKHVLPNKFNFMPGLRNAFTRTDKIYNKEGKVLASSKLIHMANPAVVKAGNDSQKLTKDNLDHLSKLSGNKKIFLSGLITPLRFIAKEEHKIHKNLKDASRNHDDVLYNNIPLNLIRSIPGHKMMKGLNSYIRNICIEISKKYGIEFDKNSSIKDFIKQIKNSKNFSASEIKDSDLRILNQIMRVDSFKSKFSFKNLFNIKNTELQLNAEMHVLNNIVNHSDLSEGNKVMPVLYCKSGKDRTEMQVELSQAKILSDQMNQQNIGLKENNILDNSLNSRHAYYINGSQYGGNAIGNFGVLNQQNINIYLGDKNKAITPLLSNNANQVHFDPKVSKFSDKEFDKNLNIALNGKDNKSMLTS